MSTLQCYFEDGTYEKFNKYVIDKEIIINKKTKKADNCCSKTS